jgi:hypothetical protein
MSITIAGVPHEVWAGDVSAYATMTEHDVIWADEGCVFWSLFRAASGKL